MPRHAFQLVSVLALAPVAAAQCLPGAGVPAGLANPDEALTGPLALGFSFPMAAAAGGPFTHCVVGSNGVVFLTDGGAAVDAAASQHGSVAELQGALGASPRLAPFWSDLWDAWYPGAGWSVDVDTSVPGRCAIVWTDCCEWPLDVPAVSFAAELFDTGVVTFSYGDVDTTGYYRDAVVGVSVGDAVADPGALDLSAGAAAPTGLAYEVLAPGAFDLAHRSISFTPTGPGWSVSTTCQAPAASHTVVGVGCYLHSDSLYEVFADANAAAAALSGQSIVFVPAAAGYTVSWGGAVFDPPTAPTVLALTDDGEVGWTPSQPLPTPHGAVTELRVHENGVVSLGAAPQTFPGTTSYLPTATGLLDAAAAAFWSWHDFHVDEPGSGSITAEEKLVGGDTVLHLTWDGVENYADPELANPSTLQFQFHLGTGVVAIVWQSIDADGTSPYGSAHVVGYSPAGPSPDEGSVVLAVALPRTTTAPLFPMQLAANPPPVSTASTGTVVTFTTSLVPEAAPGTGVYVGVLILSFSSAPGVDLAPAGAPGCFAWIGALDIVIGTIGATPTQDVPFAIPAGVAPGTEFWTQSASFVVPFSLPNGANPFGMTTSNAIYSVVRSF